MPNKSRQPVVSKAVGDPNKGRPASIISQVGSKSKGNSLDTKPLDEGKTDES